MYIPTQPVLLTESSEDGFESLFQMLPTNGTYLRSTDGRLLGKQSQNNIGLFYKVFNDDETFSGVVTDKLLSERIVTYLQNYHGQRCTNCSALAHFLTTGKFTECLEENNQAVAKQSMKSFLPGAKVGIGDMLCILYGRESIWRSRKNVLRNEFLTSRKSRSELRAINHRLTSKPLVLTAEEISDLCCDESMLDYHFMVCVDRHAGQPVWLSQLGYFRPEDDLIPLSLHKGNANPYPDCVPLLAFIKKRRK